MKNSWKRMLSLLLVLCLCVGMFPSAALAEEAESVEPIAETEPPEEEMQEPPRDEPAAEAEAAVETEAADLQSEEEPLPIERDEYGNYVIYSFGELKQVISLAEDEGLAQNGNKLMVYYRGEDAFCFEESIDLPDWLYLTIPGPYGSGRTPDIIIPQNVTVTNNYWLGGRGNGDDGDLVVAGTLVNNRNGNANGGNIIVTGRLVNKGQVYARGGTLSGADKIVRDGEYSYFAKFAYINADNIDNLISAVEDTSDYAWADEVGVQFSAGDQTFCLNQDLTIPEKTSLYVFSPLTVEAGAVLTNRNTMTVRAALTLNGELENEGDIWLYCSSAHTYPYGGEIALGESGDYKGNGRLVVSGVDPADCLPGFDLSRFQISDWGVDAKQLKLKAQLPVSGSCGTDLYYTLGEDGVLVISGTGAMEDYEWGGAPWYDLRELVTGLQLEPGITHIGDRAFLQLGNLTAVSLPEGVTSIGAQAFLGCAELESVSFPAGLEAIESYAFYNCGSLKTVQLPAGLQRIGAAAFHTCGELESVTLPSSLEAAEDEAFFNCPQLTDLYYSGSMARFREIAPSAVDRYTVTVHCSDGDIRPESRSRCGDELSWTLDGAGTLTISGSGPMWSFADGVGPWGESAEKIRTLVIKPGVTTISNEAFFGCAALETVSIPASVTRIGEYAFLECCSLQSISLPGVQSLCRGAFSGCVSLWEIKLHTGLTELGSYLFEGCVNLERVTIPAGVSVIESYCFAQSELREIAFVGSAPEFGISPFGARDLTVYYPQDDGSWSEDFRQSFGSSITWIGYDASTIRPEDACGDNLTWTLSEDGTLTISGTGAMWDDPEWNISEIKTLVLEYGVTGIAAGAFADCKKLKEIRFRGEAPAIGENAFSGVTAKAYYPREYASWTKAVRQNYGGKLTWTAYDLYPKATSVSILDPAYNDLSGKSVTVDLNDPAAAQPLFLRAVLNPEGAYQAATWTVSDTKGTYCTYTVSDCSYTGYSVNEYSNISILPSGTGKTGSVTVTAKAADGSGKSAKVTVKFVKLAHEISILGDREPAIYGGGKLTLKADVASDKSLTDKKVTWAVSDTAYANINASGVLTTKKVTEPVTVTVTATAAATGASDSVNVTIYPKVTALSFDADAEIVKNTASFDLYSSRESLTVSAAAAPANACQAVTWTVSDAKGAICTWTVNVDGSLSLAPSGTGKTGSVTVTAKAADGSGKTAKLTVKFCKFAQHLAILEGWPAELRAGAKASFKTDIASDKTLTDKAVTWTVSDTSAASITAAGALTAKKVTAPTTITVTAAVKANPAVTATAELTIYPAVTAAQISYQGEVQAKGQIVDVNLDGETTIQLTGSTLPANAIQRGTWKSSAPKVATVDETGRVTGLKAGTATITFTAADGTKKSTSVKVRVGKWTDSITLGEHAESLVSGKSMTVKATSLTVDGQTPTVKALKWISSDPNVATVSNGKVTAKTVYRNTYVSIWAIATDGSEVEAGFTLIIKPKTKEVLLLNETGWPVNGQTLTYLYESVHYLSFSSSLYDSDTDTETDPDVTWKSSNPKVAKVDNYGNIEILKPGTAKITITLGKLSATVTLKITK